MNIHFVLCLLIFVQCSGINGNKKDVWINVKSYDPEKDFYLNDTIEIHKDKIIYTSQKYDLVGVNSFKHEFTIKEILTDTLNPNRKAYVLSLQSPDTFYILCTYKLKHEKMILSSSMLYFPMDKQKFDKVLCKIFNDTLRMPYFKLGDRFWSAQAIEKIRNYPSIENDTLALYQFADMYINYLNENREEIKVAYNPGSLIDNSIDLDVLAFNGYNPWKSTLQLGKIQEKMTPTPELITRINEGNNLKRAIQREGRFKH